MALADYQTNSITNPQVAADINIHDVGTTQRYAVGMRVVRADGNEFVYTHCLTSSAAGTVVGPDVSEGGEVAGVDNAVIASASSVTTTDGTAGSKFLQFTNTGILAGEHAGGYLSIVSGTGSGYTYRIKGNDATNDTATGDVRIELYDRIVVALSTSSDVHILGSKYAQCIKVVGAAGENNLAVGVTMGIIAANGYGWICVKGICAPLIDGTIAAGEAITLSDGVAGAVQVAAGGTTAVLDLIDERVIGQCVIPDASTGQATCQVDFG